MLKRKKNECKLYNNELPGKNEYDEIWITTLFTFEIPHAMGIIKEASKRAKKIKIGGIAASLLPSYFKPYTVHTGLLPEAETHKPDYNLLDTPPEYSITHTSRGCIRNCGFCMVPKLEPKYINRDWVDDIDLKTKKVLFYDNNWTAKPFKEKIKDVEKMRYLMDQGIKEFDFNQGLDARLMTEKIADILKGIPIKPVRFAFDGMHEDGYWQRAVEMMFNRGFKDFMTYTLYNYTDTPQDFYYRLREGVRLQEKLKNIKFVSVENFPMRYQPILEINKKRDYIGKYWNIKIRNAVNTILSIFTTFGQISCHGGRLLNSIQEFEYWFGKNADEFVKLLNYPKLKQLCQRKKNYLMIKRHKATHTINNNFN